MRMVSSHLMQGNDPVYTDANYPNNPDFYLNTYKVIPAKYLHINHPHAGTGL